MKRWMALIVGVVLAALTVGCGSPDGDRGSGRWDAHPGPSVTVTSTPVEATSDPPPTATPDRVPTPEPTPEHYVAISIEDGVIRWEAKPAGAAYHIATTGEVRLVHERWVDNCRPTVIEERPLVIDEVLDTTATEYDLGLPAIPAGDHWYVLFWSGVIQIDVLDAHGAVMYAGGYSSVRDLFC